MDLTEIETLENIENSLMNDDSEFYYHLISDDTIENKFTMWIYIKKYRTLKDITNYNSIYNNIDFVD